MIKNKINWWEEIIIGGSWTFMINNFKIIIIKGLLACFCCN